MSSADEIYDSSGGDENSMQSTNAAQPIADHSAQPSQSAHSISSDNDNDNQRCDEPTATHTDDSPASSFVPSGSTSSNVNDEASATMPPDSIVSNLPDNLTGELTAQTTLCDQTIRQNYVEPQIPVTALPGTATHLTASDSQNPGLNPAHTGLQSPPLYIPTFEDMQSPLPEMSTHPTASVNQSLIDDSAHEGARPSPLYTPTFDDQPMPQLPETSPHATADANQSFAGDSVYTEFPPSVPATSSLAHERNDHAVQSIQSFINPAHAESRSPAPDTPAIVDQLLTPPPAHQSSEFYAVPGTSFAINVNRADGESRSPAPDTPAIVDQLLTPPPAEQSAVPGTSVTVNIQHSPSGFFFVASSSSDGQYQLVPLQIQQAQMSSVDPISANSQISLDNPFGATNAAPTHEFQHGAQEPVVPQPGPAYRVPPQARRKPCECPFCSVSIGNQVRDPSGEIVHVCDYLDCRQLFKRASNLRRHIAETHTGQRTFRCSQCKARFGRKEHFVKHVRAHLKRTRPRGGSGAIPCQCPYCSVDDGYVRLGHNDKRQHICHVRGCGRVFTVVGRLRRHVDSHATRRELVCRYCDKPFARENKLDIHERTHTHARRKPPECDCPNCKSGNRTVGPNGKPLHNCHFAGCDKAFEVVASLRKHLTTHGGERIFACPHCDKAFARKDKLNEHVETHAVAVKLRRTCTCPNCSAPGGNKTRSPNGTLLHVCHHEGCDRVFRKIVYLETHLKKHDEVRAYKCDRAGCEESFERKYQLAAHEKTHKQQDAKRSNARTQHPCPILNCERVFDRSSHLARHMDSHFDRKQYVCDYCNRAFTRKDTLKTHVVRLHLNAGRGGPGSSNADA